MLEPKEGLTLDSPLPPPPLTLEQIKEKLHYIKDLSIRDRVADILLKYNSGACHSFDIGASKDYFDFEVPENFKRNTKVYSLSMNDTQHLRYFIDTCINFNIIEPAPSHQQFGSPVFITTRKDKQASPRIIIDARGINSTIPYNVSSITMDPLRTLKSLLPEVGYSSFMDIRNAFYNLQLSDKVLESGITNITTSFGVFRFKRALTGYAGTPSLLLSYILDNIHLDDNGLHDLISHVLIWFDDLSLFNAKTDTIDDHLANLDKFLGRVNRLNLKLNLDKCRFCVNLVEESVDILGYTVGQGKVKIPDKKSLAISQMRPPRNLKELQSFLGNLTYYRPLISMTTQYHMNCLYKQVKNFDWDKESNDHFYAITKAMGSEECNNDSREDTDVQFLYTDASGRALGACLIGLKIRDLLPVEFPNLEPIPEKFSPLFNEIYSDNIGVIFKENHLLKLLHKISLFLNIDGIKDYTRWCLYFFSFCCLNIELYAYLSVMDESTETIFSREEINKKYILTMNALRAGTQNLNDPNIETFLLMSFSKYCKRNLKLAYLSQQDGTVKQAVISSGWNRRADTEIILSYDNHNYHYYGVKDSFQIGCHYYRKTVKNISVPDKNLYNMVAKLLRTNDDSIKGRGKILGFYSRTFGPSILRGTGIAYLEIIAVFDSIQYFYPETKLGCKTIVLTDNIAVMKILQNTKIENSKSMLDTLSQKIIFTTTDRIIFMAIPTNEQLADFLSRLIPERHYQLNFGTDRIKPVYECDLFKIFEPNPIPRDKENFKNPKNETNIKVITRGKGPELLKKYEEAMGTRRRGKNKPKALPPPAPIPVNINSKSNETPSMGGVSHPLPPQKSNYDGVLPSNNKASPQNETSDREGVSHPLPTSQPKINIDSGQKSQENSVSNKGRVSHPLPSQKLNKDLPLEAKQNNDKDADKGGVTHPLPQPTISLDLSLNPQNDFFPISEGETNPLTLERTKNNIDIMSNPHSNKAERGGESHPLPPTLNNSSVGMGLSPNVDTVSNNKEEKNPLPSYASVSREFSLEHPEFSEPESDQISNQYERSLFSSKNNSILNKRQAKLQKEFNKKANRYERAKIRSDLRKFYSNNSTKQESSNKTDSETDSENSDSTLNEDTILRPTLNLSLGNGHFLRKSYFIQRQIMTGLTKNVSPTKIHYKNNLIILPEELYDYFAAAHHADLIHPGINRLYNLMKRTYYVKVKSVLLEAIKKIIKSCATCAQTKTNNYRLEKGTSITAHNFRRNYLVQVDLLEFPSSLRKEERVDRIKAVLIFCDVATQYLTVFMLEETKKSDIQLGFAHYVAINGQVEKFHSDNGKNIRNAENEEFLNSIGSRFINSAPYRSASRGNIERRVKLIQNLIRYYSAHKNSVRIKQAICATVNQVNNFKLMGLDLSPNNLHHLSLYNFDGKINKYDELFRPNFTFDKLSLSERFDLAKTPFLKIYERNKNKIIQKHEKELRKLNKHRYPHNFKIGDLCLIRNDRKKKELYHKNKNVYDLEVWVVQEVSKFLIDIVNIFTTDKAKLSPQQLKKIDEGYVGKYKLPKSICRHFNLITLEDLREWRRISNEITKLRPLPDPPTDSQITHTETSESYDLGDDISK